MKRQKFSLSYTKLGSFDMGHLVPIGLTEVLPGDTVQQATSVLLRCTPLLAPVMHPCDIRIHHFFVPNRLVWSEWEDFITGGPQGLSLPAVPVINSATGAPVGSASDFMGVPVDAPNGLTFSAIPIRGYDLIWNEYYRDKDLESEVPVSLAGGVDTTAGYNRLLRCDWEKDYLTTARPWEQLGPSVSVPAPVHGLYVKGTAGLNPGDYFGTAASDAPVNQPTIAAGETSVGNFIATKLAATGAASGSNRPQVFAQTSMMALREAAALQRWEEARARYGSRYVEYLRYLGVRSSDARLQRPEYLGGGRAVIQFSEVLQTAPGVDTAVGELRGHGIAGMRSNRYRRFIEEHGYIHSLLSVRPKTIYAQGLPRHWSRVAREDYWQREFEHIGQQEVLLKEVYTAGSTGGHSSVFGYQDRYAEYRHAQSSVAGEFRTSLLNFWHLSRDFATQPALNASFVSCVPTERIFAVTSKATLYMQARHSIQARRLVSGSTHSHVF